MAIMKVCSRCGKARIGINEKCCSKCKTLKDKEDKERYKKYNKQRYNEPEQYKYIKFYNSKLCRC